MLEELDIVRDSQCLTYLGTHEIVLANGVNKLHAYRQIGQGLLPFHYWLDQQHRVVFATGALRAFVLRDGLTKQGAGA